MHPRVVHCQSGVPFDRYIGRSRPSDGTSPWGNPFTHKSGTLATHVVDSRDAAVAAHRTWLATQPDLLLQLGDLRHQTLGCWCAPHACHGEFLAELADALPDGPLDGPTLWQAITPVFSAYGITLAPFAPAPTTAPTARPPSALKHVACVGSRTMTADDAALLTAIGYQLVTAGWTVHSGGAVGSDQAFADGAAQALRDQAPGGLVIHLPWKGYESGRAARAVDISRHRATLDLHPFTPDERALARQHHPAPDHLSAGGLTLMARNVRIVFPHGLAGPPVHLVVALPSTKPGGGGTGQSMRLAAHFGIVLHNLTDPAIAQQYRTRLAALSPQTVVPPTHGGLPLSL